MHLSAELSLAFAFMLSWATALAETSNSTYWLWQTYRSNSAQPPELQVSKSGSTTPGYLFFDQNGDYAHNYSLFIIGDDSELIWQSDRGDYSAFQPQTLDGKPVLTFFNGITFPEPWGFGYGIIQILDETYDNIYNISLTAETEGYQGIMDSSEVWSYIDMHESKITTDNTILVTVINVTQFDLSVVDGPIDGWIADSLFYEIDPKTNEVLFRWSALEHVEQIPLENVVQFYPLEELGQNQTYPWGYFHINSVDKFDDGSYLISSRTYCSIFKISRNGSVDWTLQGRHGGDFSLGENISFCYQHDARIKQESGPLLSVSLFNNDNNAEHAGVNQTTGLILALNTDAMTAVSTQALSDPADKIYALSQGNLQELGNGHHLMGYGATPEIKEYNSSGDCVMTAKFGNGQGTIMSYRAYRSHWVGRPQSPPDAFACSGQINQTQVFMSWMGATEHEHWKVYGGLTNSSLSLVAEVPRKGFETKVDLDGVFSFIKVEANGSGNLRGMSQVIEVYASC